MRDDGPVVVVVVAGFVLGFLIGAMLFTAIYQEDIASGRVTVDAGALGQVEFACRRVESAE